MIQRVPLNSGRDFLNTKPDLAGTNIDTIDSLNVHKGWFTRDDIKRAAKIVRLNDYATGE